MEQTEITEKQSSSSSSSDDDNKPNNNHVIWDCGSSLYDSFELNSLQKQLDSAIASRSLSMPHLSDHRTTPPSPPLLSNKKPISKFSRSIHRLIKAIFRPKNSTNSKNRALIGGGFMQKHSRRDGFYVFYDRSGALTTIPEAPELDGLSPELKSLVRRTASDRFSDATLGISCS